jgi:hypothetical protein
MLTRILTLAEFRAWYKLGEKSARKMLQSGQIVALKTPGGWRIPDLGPNLLELTRRRAENLEEVPFIGALKLLPSSATAGGGWRGRVQAARQSLIEHISRRGRNHTQRDGSSRPCVKRCAQELMARKLPPLPHSFSPSGFEWSRVESA